MASSLFDQTLPSPSQESGPENHHHEGQPRDVNRRRTRRSLHYRTASEGYWVALLLPVALYVADYNLQKETTSAVFVIAANAIILCSCRWFDINLFRLLQRYRKPSAAISVAFIVTCVLNKGNLYEVTSYLALLFSFPYIFYNLVKQHPSSFTFGEGILVTAAFAYRFWGASQSLPFPQPDNPIHRVAEDDLLEIFLKLLFFGTLLGARLILLLQKPWKLFILEEMLCLWSKYCVMAFFTRIPTQNDEISIFLILWPIKFIFATAQRIYLICSWVIISGITGIYLIIKTIYSPNTTTVDRKFFHFAIVLVFLPGIVVDFQLIYCCSSVVFFIFILIEALRVLRFEVLGIRFGEIINENVRRFRDHQDEGHLILTPIYLLVGCSLPIWLTDMDENSNKKTVLYAASMAGIISIGIGDTFASIGGTYFGRTRWKDSRKTVEGTVCSIIAQISFVTLLSLFDVVPHDHVSVVSLIVAIFFNAIIEGNTDQIDNLVLPLVTFIVIHGISLLFSVFETKKEPV